MSARLIAYVQIQRSRAIHPDEIRSRLLAKGWPLQEVESALRLTEPDPAMATSHPPHWIFRLGFASIFLVNSLSALIDPNTFLKLMERSFLRLTPLPLEPMLWFIALNDLLTGALVLLGWKGRYVYIWAGMWMLAVTWVKLSTLI
ncbi:hypothetical protein [Calidithermus timidus]|jgi:hypothetical protein|uniref:hypothetical protein n=1 Tax=Calidithermus timidus TaxID=307124 RepID=UPI00036B34D6|nr:hypothetical protein [Calidithermus timidus]